MGVGSGSITHLGDNLFVNTFNLEEYAQIVGEGRLPLMGCTDLPRRDLMRYKFLLTKAKQYDGDPYAKNPLELSEP